MRQFGSPSSGAEAYYAIFANFLHGFTSRVEIVARIEAIRLSGNFMNARNQAFVLILQSVDLAVIIYGHARCRRDETAEHYVRKHGVRKQSGKIRHMPRYKPSSGALHSAAGLLCAIADAF